MSRYTAIREEACESNRQLPVLGLVIFHFGNVSVADQSAKVFAIKPSGVPYESLTPDRMVIVDFHGNVVEGDLRPSSDTPTHAVLYKHCSKMGSIVHTHSRYATAWAQALRDIPNYGTTHADHTPGDIPCAPPMEDHLIQGDYEHQTGFQILKCLEERKLSYLDVEMILVGSHAPFAWGLTAAKALYHAAVLEELAQMAFLTEQLNPAAPRLKDALARKHFSRKHGPGAYYGQKNQ